MSYREAILSQIYSHAAERSNGFVQMITSKESHCDCTVQADSAPSHRYNLRKRIHVPNDNIENNAESSEEPDGSVLHRRYNLRPKLCPHAAKPPNQYTGNTWSRINVNMPVELSTTAILASFGYLTDSSKIIGCGSFSKVYKAIKLPIPGCNILDCVEHPKKPCNTTFAIKVLKITKHNIGGQKFFSREVDLWKQLKHPNICQLFEILFYNEKLVCFVAEYCSGGDVAKVLQNSSVPHEIGRRWMCDALEALIYLHSKDIAHRDLKPENCIITETNRVKLVDFGFSIRKTGLTETFCGSCPYVAPEVLAMTPYNPFKADIWSFGCTIYVVMTRRLPFPQPNTVNKLYIEQQRNRKLVYPIETPSYVKQTVDVLLQFEEQNRPTIDLVAKLPFFKECESNV